MEGLDLINLITQGGFALVAIAILLYIVKYFMNSVNGFRGTIDNHINEQTKAFQRMADSIDRLCDLLERREK